MENEMNSKQAAKFLGYSDTTIRVSRSTGALAGVSAPPFVKQGHKIFYDEQDLIAWKSQFKKITHLAQSSLEKIH